VNGHSRQSPAPFVSAREVVADAETAEHLVVVQASDPARFRSFPIVQFPNLPLIIAFLAGEAGKLAHGTGHTYAASVSYLALTIWAYEELLHGVNWFRHLLGLAYLVIVVMRVAHALHA
jgi:hypothetical protein